MGLSEWEQKTIRSLKKNEGGIGRIYAHKSEKHHGLICGMKRVKNRKWD